MTLVPGVAADPLGPGAIAPNGPAAPDLPGRREPVADGLQFTVPGTIPPGPTPEAGKGFVVLGDSLSAWTFDRGSWIASRQGTWPALLDRLDPDLELLNNAGVPGNTTAEMLSRLRADVLAYHPDVLLVLGGTNDIEWRFRVEDTIANLRSIARTARDQGIEVVLLTVPPNNRLYTNERAWLRRLNAGLKALAATEGVRFVDTYAALATSNGHLAAAYAAADRLHLNRSGEEVIARTVFEAMHSPDV